MHACHFYTETFCFSKDFWISHKVLYPIKRGYHFTIFPRLIKLGIKFLKGNTIIRSKNTESLRLIIMCCTFFVYHTYTTYIIKWLYLKIINWKQMKIVNKNLHSFFLHEIYFLASQSLIIYSKKLLHHAALFINLIYSKWITQYNYNVFEF